MRSVMGKFLVLILSCVSFSVCAQVGRFEEPVDTISIGGQTQENKEIQMQAQDRLAKEMIAIRDSLQYLSAENASDRKRQLDEVLRGLEAHDHSPELMKKGYTLLNEIRLELRSQNDKSRKSFRK